MPKHVVVTYAVRPEAKAEHVQLIERVFTQLQAEHPDDVDYQVLCLADGVSFVHVSSHDTVDGVNPLPKLAAFIDFSRDIADRVATPPVAAEALSVGRYRGLVV